jgi:hypothetical protein
MITILGGGWQTGVNARDVVTSRILPRIFFEKGVTLVVTGRDRGMQGRREKRRRGEHRTANFQRPTLNCGREIKPQRREERKERGTGGPQDHGTTDHRTRDHAMKNT